MSTLTYSHGTAIGADTVAGGRTAGKSGTPLWRRIFDAMITARQQRAEREIAGFLASRGWQLTDATEREIMERLSGSQKRSV